jgi:hypothetical protein
MGVVVVCCGLVALGLIAVVRWGGLDLQPPPDGDVARRYVWWVTVAAAAGVGSGLLMSGPGGRLAMRLLAATAGAAAQGRVTEAEEVVGRITVGGSVGFVLFIGLGSGLASSVLYLLAHRWLPRGRLGGLTFGGLILVVFAPGLDPLRKANPDFDLVGPGWLAVVVFVALGLAHGMLVAAVAARYSRTLPLIAKDGRVLVRYSPLVLLLPLVTPAAFVIVIGLLVVGVNRLLDARSLLDTRRVLLAGRVVLVLGALVALPSFVGAVVDIAGRGP